MKLPGSIVDNLRKGRWQNLRFVPQDSFWLVYAGNQHIGSVFYSGQETNTAYFISLEISELPGNISTPDQLVAWTGEIEAEARAKGKPKITSDHIDKLQQSNYGGSNFSFRPVAGTTVEEDGGFAWDVLTEFIYGTYRIAVIDIYGKLTIMFPLSIDDDRVEPEPEQPCRPQIPAWVTSQLLRHGYRGFRFVPSFYPVDYDEWRPCWSIKVGETLLANFDAEDIDRGYLNGI